VLPCQGRSFTPPSPAPRSHPQPPAPQPHPPFPIGHHLPPCHGHPFTPPSQAPQSHPQPPAPQPHPPFPNHLPSRLIEQASFALPNPCCRPFTDALAGSSDFKEFDLKAWDGNPPYQVIVPNDSPEERRITEKLVQAMHGRRLHQERAADTEREEWCNAGPAPQKTLIFRLRCDLALAIISWKKLDEYLLEYSGCDREVCMARHSVQWLARSAYHITQILKHIESEDHGISCTACLYITR
jgi:hypothetical protein